MKQDQPIKQTICVIALIICLSLIAVKVSFANPEEEQTEELIEEQSNDTPVTEEPAQATTIAPNLDLKEVSPMPEPVLTPEQELQEEISTFEDSEDKSEEVITETEEIDTVNNFEVTTEEPTETEDEPEEPVREKLIILGAEVPEGSATRLAWSPPISISGLALPTPVLVINGANPGPTVCLTSAIHGDELNGIEVVRRVMYDIEPKELSGTIIGVPIVNLQGFQRTSRYLSDRRDLNRFFPGNPRGSLASRIAYSLFTNVISHCNYLIDLHTGSFRRNNLPQIRANMRNEKVAAFVQNFDKMAVVHHPGGPGMLRSVANQEGIIAITMELGESMRIQENQINAGTHSINSMLERLEMYSRTFIWGNPTPTYYESRWLRVGSGGILFSETELGDQISEGDVLGVVTDPITNESTEVISPVKGRIIGMASNQVVVPGFAAYHIGIESTQEDMTHSEDDIDMDPDLSEEGVLIDSE